MFGKRKRVIYIPYPVKGGKINEVTVNICDVLREKYKVYGELSSLVDIIRMIDTKAIFLNWIEEKLDNRMKCQLVLHQMFGAKIIWVFHNKLPHNMQKGSNAISNMKWLADRCDVIWLLSESSRKYIPNRKKNRKKAVYIPHIAYKSQMEDINIEDIRIHYGISEKDFVFTIFGAVDPYKNIEGGIEAFKRLGLINAKLVIAGNPINVKYAKQIENMCAGNKDIILDLRFIPNMLLNGIIGVSDVILMPYQNKSSMNSGVMIQAFSNGRTVISPDICMARDFAKEKFLYIWHGSLENAMKKAYLNGKEINRRMGDEARHYMDQRHNEKVVGSQLFSMIESKKYSFKKGNRRL